MAETYILNRAISILRNECASHESCEECPMGKVSPNGYIDCLLHYDPCRWQLLKEKTNDNNRNLK